MLGWTPWAQLSIPERWQRLTGICTSGVRRVIDGVRVGKIISPVERYTYVCSVTLRNVNDCTMSGVRQTLEIP